MYIYSRKHTNTLKFITIFLDNPFFIFIKNSAPILRQKNLTSLDGSTIHLDVQMPGSRTIVCSSYRYFPRVDPW